MTLLKEIFGEQALLDLGKTLSQIKILLRVRC
jgi:hypothetical protein